MTEDASTIAYWLSLPRVWRGWVRVLTPNGRLLCDCRESELFGVLEIQNEPHTFYRREEWREFLTKKLRDSQRAIASDWDLRHTVTASDRVFLAELKVAWEPETFRHARWRASHGHDDDFLFGAAH
jgi:hypothetical protein